MHGRTVIITGANSGIGLATAKALAAQGATVVMTARDAAKGEAAAREVANFSRHTEVFPITFDLSSLKSVRQGAGQILDRFDKIHVLINNAGLVLSDRRVSADGYEMTFAVNHLGPFLLTNLLLERMETSSPSRIINVASTAHTQARHGVPFDDLQSAKNYKGMKAYGVSKLENILFTTELARRLEKTTITANALHPGVVATGYARDGDTKGIIAFGIKVIKPFVLTPEQGAKTSIYLAADPGVEKVTGKYFYKCKPKTPSKSAQDAYAAQHLWKVSEELITQAAARASG
jgi:NAD(P)-dependent dehydrogenase (short-subunit alcohol dehydrogenase family)